MSTNRLLVKDRDHNHYLFYCPGCKAAHAFDANRWTVDVEKLTTSPSLLSTYPDGRVCHLFMREGKLEFLSDCYHELAGKTVPMEEL